MTRYRMNNLAVWPMVLVLAAGCSEKPKHTHRPAEETAAPAPPPRVAPPPPAVEQTRADFLATVEPQLAAKIRQRLNVANVKQKLVLAVAMPPDDSNPLVQPLMDRLKSDPSLSGDFEVVPTFAAATDQIPPGLTSPPAPVAPDGSRPQQTTYNPDDIYVLSIRYTETRADNGELMLTARCRLTHPQSRELVLQISPTARQTWDGSAWRLQP